MLIKACACCNVEADQKQAQYNFTKFIKNYKKFFNKLS